MLPIDLLRCLRRRPFRPFRLLVTTGATFEIRHPDQLLVGLSTVTLQVPDTGSSVFVFQRDVEIALSHIVLIDTLPPTVTPSSN